MAAALQEWGVMHVYADALVPHLVADGAQPHPELGWLAEVEAALDHALRSSAALRSR